MKELASYGMGIEHKPITPTTDFYSSLFIFLTIKFQRMKKLLLLLAITGLFATSSFAQDKTKDMQKEKAEWDKKIKEELKLNADQIAKYDALNKEYSDKMSVIGNDASLTKDAQKEKKMALKKEKEAKLFEFLTPEQQTKYKELKEQMMKKTTAKT
jgi:hypothetical protein